MAREQFEEKFLDYLENTLPQAERIELERTLNSDPELRASFEGYAKVVEIEKVMRAEAQALSASFDVKVMDRIEEEQTGFIGRLFMSLSRYQRGLGGLAATAAVVTLVVLVTKEVGVENVTKPMMVSSESKEVAAPQAPVAQTPPAAIAGLVPNLNQPKKKASEEDRPIENPPREDRQSENDNAKRLEELKANPLKGDQENSSPGNSGGSQEPGSSEEPDTIQMQDLFDENALELQGGTPAANAPSTNEVVMYDSDAKTGKKDKYLLRNGKWAKDMNYEGESSKSSTKAVAPEKKLEEAAPSDPAALDDLTAGAVRGRANSVGASAGAIPAQSEQVYARSGRVPSSAINPSLEKRRQAAREEVGNDGSSVSPKPQNQAHFGYEPSKPMDRMIMVPPPYSPPSYLPPPASISRENYQGYTENPRVAVKEQPVSTFSIDVDTASYANARRMLKNGSLPPTDSVRIEEFINYFDYQYPTVTEKPFGLDYEIAPSPLDPQRYLLKIGIKARDLNESVKPWNLVFLIDTSGSMDQPDKLPLVKEGLKVLVGAMRPSDRIAIVTYAGNAGLVLDSTSTKERERILSSINNLSPGGSTYGSGGIQLAYEVAERNRLDGGVNRVVLATDGDFNVGITSRDELVKMIEEKRRGGTTLTTLGVGTGNINDATLEQLADKGNGNYFYLDSFQEARKVLKEEVAGTMEVVAKDVKLQVEFNPTNVSQYRLIGYDNRKLKNEEFNDDTIDAGEIGAGHRVTALYEVVLADSPLAKEITTELRYGDKSATVESKRAEAGIMAPPPVLPKEIAFLKVRYKDPEANSSKLLEFPIERERIKGSANEASKDFQFAAAVSYFGALLRKSQFAGEYSYADVAKLAEGAKGEDANGYRREFIELVKNASAVVR